MYGSEAYELVVGADGSIPASQLARVGLRPGTHLRAVPQKLDDNCSSIEGRLATWPEVTWDDFERGSRLAASDPGAS